MKNMRLNVKYSENCSSQNFYVVQKKVTIFTFYNKHYKLAVGKRNT